MVDFSDNFSSIRKVHSFLLLKQPSFAYHDILRALSVLSENSDFLQEKLYQSRKELVERKTGVLFYDCTNFFFEIEEEKGMRKYGHSKEKYTHL